jgi:hypothetical protein
MSTIVRRSALGAAIASLALGVAAPSFARIAPTVFADGSSMKLDQSSGNFCLTEKVTGSQIPQITCRSKEDWAKDGLTVTVK